MKRRRLLQSATVVATGLSSVAIGSQESTARSRSKTDEGYGNDQFQNPVFEPIFADPSAIRTDDGWYYAFGTMDNWGPDDGGWHVLPIIRSKDLVNWEFVGDVFPSGDDAEELPLGAVPDWYDGGDAEFVWAPDVSYHDGEYHLFYSLVDSSPDYNWENQSIGVATADGPAGPWEDRGEVLQGSDVGVGNSIDPDVTDVDGTPYLAWGSFDGIYLVELVRDGDGWTYTGDPTRIASDRFEAAYIIERKGWYYLFVSSGECCGGPDDTYQIEVGRSRSIDGPYVNEHGEKLTEAPGSLVVDDNEVFGAPGHNSVVTDDAGQDWLLYHAYDRDEPGFVYGVPRRPMLLDPIQWRGSWPQLLKKEPSTSQREPVIHARNRS